MGNPSIDEDFTLGRPALVCRWRLANRRLPMTNRHLRAFGSRTIAGEPISTQLVAWAKQHVEWTLEDGSAAYPDGVLMVVVDEQGRAAMTVGPFEELVHRSVNDLVDRAAMALTEAGSTRVAPESLWVVEGNTLVCGLPQDLIPSGATTLINDLARTLGIPVRRDEDLVASVNAGEERFDEAFLVSDEFGVVPASNASGPRSRKFETSYQKLLDSTK